MITKERIYVSWGPQSTVKGTDGKGDCIYQNKECLKLNNINNLLKKSNKGLRYFPKEDIQMVNRHMKRCSPPIVRDANQNHNELPPHDH